MTTPDQTEVSEEMSSDGHLAAIKTSYKPDSIKCPITHTNAFTQREQPMSVSTFYDTDKSATATSSFSSNLQSKLQEVASKEAIKIKERDATNEPHNSVRNLTGAMTVMTGLNENHMHQSASESTTKMSSSFTMAKDPSTNTTLPKNSMQSLYEKHYSKASDFLKDIKEDSMEVVERKGYFISSPGGSVLSSESGDLSVKVDHE